MSQTAALLTETDFRARIQAAFDRIEKGLSEVDPDLAECEQAMGVLTILFPDRTRCILSAQPSVRQLWLAMASLGTAYHFNFDPDLAVWRDDKGREVELLTYLEKYLSEKTGQKIRI